MKNKLLLLFFLLGVFFPLSAQESEVLISTSHTSLLLSTSQGGELKFLTMVENLLMLMYMLLLVQSLEVFPLIQSTD